MTTKKCAGTYKVSGYTREDNAKVDSYWRTCGAKHENSDNSTSSQSTSKSKDGVMTGAAAGVTENNFLEKKDLTIQRLSKSLADEYFYNLFLGDLQKRQELSNNYPEAYHKYYKLSLDYENQKQYNKENSYIKFKDIQSDEVKLYIKDNLKKLDIPYVDNYTDVVIPQQDSRLVKTVYNSPEFETAIKTHYEKIKKRGV